MVVLVSEIFGSSHLQSNYMFFDGGCGASGTILLANLLPRIFNSPEGSCDDVCFARTHAAIGAVCLLGAAAASTVAVSSTQLYWKIGSSREAARLRKKMHESRPLIPAAPSMQTLSPWEVRADFGGPMLGDAATGEQGDRGEN
jgi:hypothetical protein